MNIDFSKLRSLIRIGSQGTSTMNQFPSNAKGITASLISDGLIDMNTKRGKGEAIIIVTDIFIESPVFYILTQSMIGEGGRYQ